MLAHRAWGAAPDPLALLVHGGTGSSAQWHELGRWLSVRGWQPIAVDLRGHGETPVDAATIASPSFDTDATDLVETIAAVRPDVTGVDLLLGHSYGAIVGLVCATSHPTFARRLALLEPGGRESSDRAQFAAEKRAQFEDPEGFVRRLYARDDAFARMANAELDAFVRARVAAITASNQAYALARHEMFAGVDIVALASRCRVPTLVVVGRDKETPLGHESSVLADLRHYSALIGEERRRFCAAFPRGRTQVLSCGHDVYRTMPAELTHALATWLADTESARDPAVWS